MFHPIFLVQIVLENTSSQHVQDPIKLSFEKSAKVLSYILETRYENGANWAWQLAKPHQRLNHYVFVLVRNRFCKVFFEKF